MEYKIVEAWGAMSYYCPEEHKTLYEDTEDKLQCYWVVKYDPKEKEIISWEKMFPDEDIAERYLDCLAEKEAMLKEQL